ncbi:hypothetical protein GCM10010293_40660 [Streptomyces griseoflavus]|uniref:hypothetical protein n=1 Tax=Streptomyces griseoflavus TaxID=35619 RepID=UPI00167E6C81|nr:hypothetical protein [Streptomyces griseoflavus]GGV37020.1 hypothetical protein GCM10010293_40660 [Streptomyces griseoflavus]
MTAPLPHAADSLPIVTANDGQPYLPCEAVLILLRAIATSCRDLADDLDCDLHTAGAAIDVEADALEFRAIAATQETP